MSEDEPHLPYEMIGEDASSSEEKIEKYMGEVDWSYLSPHLRSGVLYFVDPALEVKEVAKAFTSDDKDSVYAYLKKGDLVKMDHLHAEWFEKNPKKFTAVVVTPFVLCQPVQ